MKRIWNVLMAWAESMAKYRRHNSQYRGYY